MLSRILPLLASLGLVSASVFAADDSFVGKWKLNPDKSQFSGLPYKIEDAGGGQYRSPVRLPGAVAPPIINN